MPNHPSPSLLKLHVVSILVNSHFYCGPLEFYSQTTVSYWSWKLNVFWSISDVEYGFSDQLYPDQWPLFQAYLSPGRGGIVLLPRLTPAGQSAEVSSLTRLISCLVGPPTVGRMMRSMAVKYMDYPSLNLHLGDNPFTTGVSMVSDDLRYRLVTG